MNVSLLLQDCYVFALGGVDIILGVAWLAILGDVKVNWETMSMVFDWKGMNVVLKGDLASCRSPMGLRTLTRIKDVEFWVVLLEGEPANSIKDEPTQVEQILQGFVEVFGEPTELPPHRITDHIIDLAPGAGPVSVHHIDMGRFKRMRSRN